MTTDNTLIAELQKLKNLCEVTGGNVSSNYTANLLARAIAALQVQVAAGNELRNRMVHLAHVGAGLHVFLDAITEYDAAIAAKGE